MKEKEGLIIPEHTQKETNDERSLIIISSLKPGGGWGLSCESVHVKQFTSGRNCAGEWEASLPFTRKAQVQGGPNSQPGFHS